MTLQQFLNDYHLDCDDDNYDTRYDYAECFVCDAQEHPDINYSLDSIYAFAEKAFNVELM